MRRKSRIPLVLGLLLLLVVVMGGVYLYLTSLRQPGETGVVAPLIPDTPVPKVRVLLAKRTIPADTILTPEMIENDFEVREIPRSEVTIDDAVGSKTQLFNKYTRVTLEPGLFLSLSQFGEVTLSFKIPEGKRAVPLKVDQFSGVVGRIAAEDYVDIVFSSQIELAFPQAFPPVPEELTFLSPVNLLSVKTILQDVQVLEVVSVTTAAAAAPGQPQPTPSGEGPLPTPVPVVTEWILILAVDDQQAEVLKFAQDNGMSYQMLLRARGDHGLATTTGITTRILIDSYRLPVPEQIPYPVNPRDVPRGSIP